MTESQISAMPAAPAGLRARAECDAVQPFDPADAACWIAHGRPAAVAEAIASAWRLYPDLPAAAPLDLRQARTRERVTAMRPFMDELAAATSRARELTNFRFVKRAVAAGSDDPRHARILQARDQYDLSWDEAIQFADGAYAAEAGWPYRPPTARPAARDESLRGAYDRGFAEGGGRPDDVFDAARRALNRPAPMRDDPPAPSRSRPSPSEWPGPTDAPRPARWPRRLLIIGASSPLQADFLDALRHAIGAEATTILLAKANRGYARLGAPAATLDAEDWRQLHAFTAGLEFDDILIAADGADLAQIDEDAAALPICRTMERTRNSALQQRQQFRTWLERGLGPGEIRASGHIRWGKAIAGLRGRLGEFTARYDGPAAPKGHRILVERADGAPAIGFETVDGKPLDPERIISNRSRLRAEISTLLRAFAAALPTAAAMADSPGSKG